MSSRSNKSTVQLPKEDVVKQINVAIDGMVSGTNNTAENFKHINNLIDKFLKLVKENSVELSTLNQLTNRFVGELDKIAGKTTTNSNEFEKFKNKVAEVSNQFSILSLNAFELTDRISAFSGFTEDMQLQTKKLLEHVAQTTIEAHGLNEATRQLQSVANLNLINYDQIDVLRESRLQLAQLTSTMADIGKPVIIDDETLSYIDAALVGVDKINALQTEFGLNLRLQSVALQDRADKLGQIWTAEYGALKGQKDLVKKLNQSYNMSMSILTDIQDANVEIVSLTEDQVTQIEGTIKALAEAGKIDHANGMAQALLQRKSFDSTTKMFQLEQHRMRAYAEYENLIGGVHNAMQESIGLVANHLNSLPGPLKSLINTEKILLNISASQKKVFDEFVDNLGTKGTKPIEALSTAFSGMGKALWSAIGPIGLILITTIALVKAIFDYGAKIESIKKDLNVTSKTAQELYKHSLDITTAWDAGLTTEEDVLDVLKAHKAEYGNILDLSKKENQESVKFAANLATKYGVAAGEVYNMTQLFQQMGASVEDSEGLTAWLGQASELAGIPFDNISKDLAENANYIANRFGDAYVNAAKTAVELRRQGMSMGQISKFVEKSLDPSSFLSDMAEINAMTKGAVDLTDLFEMRFSGAGETEMADEIMNQYQNLLDSGADEFTRRKFAASVGMETAELDKTYKLREKMAGMDEEQQRLLTAHLGQLSEAELKDKRLLALKAEELATQENFGKAMSQAKNELQKAFLPLIQSSSKLLTGLVPILKTIGKFIGVWASLINLMLTPFTLLFKLINSIAESLGFGSKTMSGMADISNKFAAVWDSLGPIIQNVLKVVMWGGLVAIGSQFGIINKMLLGLPKLFTGAFSKIPGLSKIFNPSDAAEAVQTSSGMLDKMKSLFTTKFSSITDSIKDKIKSLFTDKVTETAADSLTETAGNSLNEQINNRTRTRGPGRSRVRSGRSRSGGGLSGGNPAQSLTQTSESMGNFNQQAQQTSNSGYQAAAVILAMSVAIYAIAQAAKVLQGNTEGFYMAMGALAGLTLAVWGLKAAMGKDESKIMNAVAPILALSAALYVVAQAAKVASGNESALLALSLTLGALGLGLYGFSKLLEGSTGSIATGLIVLGALAGIVVILAFAAEKMKASMEGLIGMGIALAGLAIAAIAFGAMLAIIGPGILAIGGLAIALLALGAAALLFGAGIALATNGISTLLTTLMSMTDKTKDLKLLAPALKDIGSAIKDLTGGGFLDTMAKGILGSSDSTIKVLQSLSIFAAPINMLAMSIGLLSDNLLSLSKNLQTINIDSLLELSGVIDKLDLIKLGMATLAIGKNAKLTQDNTQYQTAAPEASMVSNVTSQSTSSNNNEISELKTLMKDLIRAISNSNSTIQIQLGNEELKRVNAKLIALNNR